MATFDPGTPNALPEDGGGESASLVEIVRLILSRKYLVAGVALACTVCALAAALLITPVYRGDVTIVPVAAEGETGRLAALASQFGGLASALDLNVGGSTEYSEAMATIRSRDLARQFIESNQLLPSLFPDKWDAEKGTWNVSDPEDVPTIYDGVVTFTEDVLSIVENQQAGIVTLSVEDRDRQRAADWANGLVKLANEILRERARAEAEMNIGFLNEELAKTSVVETRAVIYGLVEKQLESRMLANTQEQYAFEIVDPAIVPDEDDEVWPERKLIVIGGLLFGILLGVFIVLAQRALSGLRVATPK